MSYYPNVELKQHCHKVLVSFTEENEAHFCCIHISKCRYTL